MVATTRRRKAEGDSESPLRALNTPPKRARKPAKKAPPPPPEPVVDSDDIDPSDPGAGIFFRERPISYTPEPKEVEEEIKQETIEEEKQVEDKQVDASVVAKLESRILELEGNLNQSQQQTDNLLKENEALRREIVELKGAASSKQVNGIRHKQYDDGAFPQQPIATPTFAGPMYGSEAAMKLLSDVEKNARATPQRVKTPNREVKSPSSPNRQNSQSAMDLELASSSHPVLETGLAVSSQPVTETRPVASSESPEATTAPTPTSKLRGSILGFGRLWSSLSSAFTPSSTPSRSMRSATTPATAAVAPANQVTQESAQASNFLNEIALGLTPSPSVVREPSKQAKPKKKRTKGHRQAMIKKVVNSVDPDERATAKAWAKDVLSRLPMDGTSLGDKRKRLRDGVKIRDLKNLGTKPWLSGSYGLDDDIYDLSDDDDAPAWAVLQNIVLEEQENQPPTKKHKTDREVDMEDEVTPLNEMIIPGPSEQALPTAVSTKGKSALLSDMRPRPSILPSPMFQAQAVHKEGANVFHERKEQDDHAEQHAALKRSFGKSASASFGSYSVPEDHSSDEDVDEEPVGKAGAGVWTQQPPPAPVPAHASLPTPLAETAVASDASAIMAVDPVELQRAKITKHTPAKPSRLREMHVPSPSLRSDAGDSTLLSASPFSPFNMSAQASGSGYHPGGIPSARALDIPASARSSLQSYTSSEDFGRDCTATNWAAPLLTYPQDDDQYYISPTSDDEYD